LLFFDFFDFEAVVSDAVAGAEAAVAAGADAAAASALLFFDFDALPPEAASAGAAGAGVCAVVAAGAGVDFDIVPAGALAGAPVGGADEPLIVRPAASRFFTDFCPMPLTRLARSSASLNGPFLVRSSMIALAWAGPMPLTDSSAAWSAELTSTAAAYPADSDRTSATNNINSFFNMAITPLRANR
jgi:hypothetical protein